MADQAKIFRVKAVFPGGNTKSTAWVKAESRMQAKWWAEDHWIRPVIRSVTEFDQKHDEDAELFDATGDMDG